MAQDNNTPGGLFGLGIIPSQSRQQLERDAGRQRQANAMERGNYYGQGRAPGFQRMSERFAMGMDALAQKKRGTALSDEQDMRLGIQEQGVASFQEQLAAKTDAGEEVSAEQQRLMLMTEMQKAAMARGDVAAFTQLGQAISQQRQQDRMAEAKLREAENLARSSDPMNPAYQREIAQELWQPSERMKIRDGRMAFRRQLDQYDGVVTMFEEMVDEGLDPNTAATSVAGGPVGFLQKATSGLGALGNEFKRLFVDDGEGNMIDAGAIDGSVAGMDRLRRSSSKFADALDFIAIPASVNKSAKARAQYQAAVIRMAYAAWRQNEGSGSRQASDQDILNALQSIGADSGDFRIMMNTTLQTVREGLASQVREQGAIEEMARYHGLTSTFTDSYFGGSMFDDIQRTENLFERSAYLEAQFSPQEMAPADQAEGGTETSGQYGGFDTQEEYDAFLDTF